MAGAMGWCDESLREVLEERRRELHEDLQRRMTRIREESAGAAAASESDGGDPNDLDVRLLELTAGTLHGIERALVRLGQGRYGRCARCREAIDASRLRAMPFAAHCQPCEAAREREVERRQPHTRTRLLPPDRGGEEGARRDSM